MAQILDSTKLRRELHPLAEIGMDVKNTSAYVIRRLKEIGIDAHRVGETYGVTGYIDSGAPGPVIALRADMDALPFEQNGKTVAIHACGHDGHMAMLLEAASRLVGKIRRGKVKLIFQPAEEPITGAQALIKEGILDDVDIIIGAHVRPVQDLKPGTLCPSVCHTSSGHVHVTIHGKSSHAARPHLGVNAIYVATAIVNAVAQIHMNPENVWSVKPTQLRADDGAFNVVPATATLCFDFRGQTNELVKSLTEQMNRIFKNTAEAYGATVDVKYDVICPAANLDPDITEELAQCIRDTAGADRLAPGCGGGGEDFHFYKLAKPSIKNGYFGVGTGVTPGLHKINMTMDDTLLPMGSAVFVKFVLNHLG
ncbi:amidohydrolase [Mesosutterella sp. AGMB02718]|uniref:Amidohydrolase n=1 Tax=Mesosutterella faecium TaxID=2925194 RepID=A0ABT7IMB4_9BURK|nr:amidohydrolase [Mesosutterella sp. AGMB02718]MDL2059504.1 amidohydrolase [Mesosutterella sp. AGMB02718]